MGTTHAHACAVQVHTAPRRPHAQLYGVTPFRGCLQTGAEGPVLGGAEPGAAAHRGRAAAGLQARRRRTGGSHTDCLCTVHHMFRMQSGSLHMAASGWRQARAAAVTWVSHSAVLLQGEEKERFNAIAEELSQLSTKFSNHVLDGELMRVCSPDKMWFAPPQRMPFGDVSPSDSYSQGCIMQAPRHSRRWSQIRQRWMACQSRPWRWRRSRQEPS
jgi:hypothetical protein